jgi:hypothetical protein
MRQASWDNSHKEKDIPANLVMLPSPYLEKSEDGHSDWEHKQECAATSAHSML